jgi:hypothetical protein
MAGDGQWGVVVAMVGLGGLCLGWGGEVGYRVGSGAVGERQTLTQVACSVAC